MKGDFGILNSGKVLSLRRSFKSHRKSTLGPKAGSRQGQAGSRQGQIMKKLSASLSIELIEILIIRCYCRSYTMVARYKKISNSLCAPFIDQS